MLEAVVQTPGLNQRIEPVVLDVPPRVPGLPAVVDRKPLAGDRRRPPPVARLAPHLPHAGGATAPGLRLTGVQDPHRVPHVRHRLKTVEIPGLDLPALHPPGLRRHAAEP